MNNTCEVYEELVKIIDGEYLKKMDNCEFCAKKANEIIEKLREFNSEFSYSCGAVIFVHDDSESYYSITAVGDACKRCGNSLPKEEIALIRIYGGPPPKLVFDDDGMERVFGKDSSVKAHVNLGFIKS